MKKLFFICSIFFQSAYFLAIDDWNNPENFTFQTPVQDRFEHSCYHQKYPNKPVIVQHLPNEAYQWIKVRYQNHLTPSKEFIEFLKQRSEFHDSEIEAQWKLIQTLTLNYRSNKNLTSLTLPMSAFASAAADLFSYQFTAESRYYSSNYPLTSFEQKYSFELYPTTYTHYSQLIQSMSPTVRDLYRKTVLKKWARYLLKNLTKK